MIRCGAEDGGGEDDGEVVVGVVIESPWGPDGRSMCAALRRSNEMTVGCPL